MLLLGEGFSGFEIEKKQILLMGFSKKETIKGKWPWLNAQKSEQFQQFPDTILYPPVWIIHQWTKVFQMEQNH